MIEAAVGFTVNFLIVVALTLFWGIIVLLTLGVLFLIMDVMKK